MLGFNVLDCISHLSAIVLLMYDKHMLYKQMYSHKCKILEILTCTFFSLPDGQAITSTKW